VPNFLFYALVAAIPLGTRIFVYQFAAFAGEYGTFYIYASDFLLLACVILGLYRYKFSLFQGKRSAWLIGFLAIAFISVASAQLTGLAFSQFDRLLLAALAALTLGRLLQEKKIKFDWLVGILGGVALVEAVLGISQFIKQGSVGLFLLGEPLLGSEIQGVAKVVVDGAKIVRVYGTFPHPNVLAAFLLVGLCALYYFWLRRPSVWKFFGNFKTLASDIGFGTGIFIVSLGLLLTFSRTAWVIAVGITAVLLIYTLCNRQYYVQGIRFGILMFAVVLVLGFNFRPYLGSRLQLQADEPAVSLRAEYNRLAVDTIKSRPLGIGIGNQVPYAVMNGAYEKVGLPQPWQWQPVHNIYLLIAVETGVIGALLFLVFVARLLMEKWRKKQDQLLNLQCAIACSMFAALLLFGLTDHFLWTLQPGRLLFWLAAGILIGV